MQKVGNTTDTADANGEWTNGNVAQGVPPTIINATILNTWQRELIGVVEGAGISLDPTDDNQVVKAINKTVGGGRLLNVKTFTVSGTYTPIQETKFVIVEAVGGGGGGGGCGSTSSTNAAVSGGGGSGSYVRAKLNRSEIAGSSISVIIGSGGAGGVGSSSGDNGSDTKFGSLLVASGGGGGTTSTNSSSAAFIAAGGPPGNDPSGGNIVTSKGSRGGLGLFFNTSAGAIGGDGAQSPLGGGGVGSGSSGATGTQGSGYGAGGGGNSRQPSSEAVNGYPGSSGVLIIYEYS
ncbi:glycine-rich domain-containing protein [Serratia fonticola]